MIQTNDTVSLDFMTCQDLAARTGSTLSLDKTKIYIIVTYAVAFDRFVEH